MTIRDPHHIQIFVVEALVLVYVRMLIFFYQYSQLQLPKGPKSGVSIDWPTELEFPL